MILVGLLALAMLSGLSTPVKNEKKELYPWSVEGLAESFHRGGSSHPVFDPDGYLSDSSKTEIKQTIAQLKKFSTILVVIGSMAKDSQSKDTIHDFAEQFLMKVMESQVDRNRNLLVFYCIKDRAYRIRTGKNAREVLSDSECTALADSIKSYLKSETYDEAFTKLFSDLLFKIRYGWIITWAIILSFVVVAGFILYQCVKTAKREGVLKKRISRIKDIAATKPDFKLFIEENCVICLEAIDQDDVRKFKAFQRSEMANQPQYVPLQNRIREEKTETEKDSAFIQCGHNFHYDCIKSWLAKYPNCPICRAKVENESARTTTDYRTFLMGIQRDELSPWYNPHQIDYYYDNGRFQNTSSNSNGNSNRGNGSRKNYDSGTGGTTGGW
jgi:uncharacterized membrane protein YgcG